MKPTIYLFFNGNCEEALNFYKEALNGSVAFMQRFKDAPMDTPEEQKEKIMHASLDVGGTHILLSDSDASNNVQFGNNFSISLSFNNNAEQDRAFMLLSTGGQVTMPLEDTFWGSRFGMCTDKFGVNWMFSTEHKQG